MKYVNAAEYRHVNTKCPQKYTKSHEQICSIAFQNSRFPPSKRANCPQIGKIYKFVNFNPKIVLLSPDPAKRKTAKCFDALQSR